MSRSDLDRHTCTGDAVPATGLSPDISFASFYVASYPRSGNTWFRQMLIDLLNPIVLDENPRFHRRRYIKLPYTSRPALDFPTVRSAGRHMIKTHGRYETCQADMPIVYLVRDGRDSAYSYYHFNLDHKGYTESWEHYFDRFIARRRMANYRERYLDRFMGSWSENYMSFKGRSNVMMMRYEDLKEDTFGVLRQVLVYINAQSVSDDAIRAIIKNHEQRLQKKQQSHDRPRGQQEGWRSVFTEQQREIFWGLHGQALAELGYSR